jgi:murein L,D-transpeptidase YcbB/YkuD
MPQLSRFLVALGDLDSLPAAPDTLYQGPVVEAVQRFQRRHGLAPDSVLGPATFRALNTPLAARVGQIELALERLRWLPEIGAQRFLVVNIPAFELFAFDSAGGRGAPALEMRVIVGRSLQTRTPILLEQLAYVEFHPYWNVPRGILLKEVLPQLGRHPGYLRSNDMEVIVGKNEVLGDTVTPRVLRGLASGAFSIRQRPGPRNPLGPVKFVFPNAEAIYLHATPEPELFAKTRRDFSHGCVRVEEPAELARWVLQDRPGWTLDSVTSAIQAPQTTRDSLPQPMSVIIFYTTAVARPDGTAWFYGDIYKIDSALARLMGAD